MSLSEETVVAYLLLGSNIGERARFLTDARLALDANPKISVRNASMVYESAAMEMAESAPPFLNQVVKIDTSLTPEALLEVTQAIERQLGRTGGKGMKQNRTIDIDILLYGELVLASGTLVIPHPALLRRRFALEPLADMAGDALHPITGKSFGWHLRQLRQPENTPLVAGQDA